MYWWDVQSLKSLLAKGPLPSRMAVQYVLSHALLVAIGLMAGSAVPRNRDVWIMRTGALIVTTIGILYCYRCNGGAGGQAFMDRYFAISWVVYLRWFGVVVVIFLCEAVVLSATLPAYRWPLVTMPSILLAVGALYWRVGVHLADLAKRSGSAGTG
jgi:hypothetical protein